MLTGTQPVTKKPIMTVVLENCKKLAVKHSLEKPILINFGNLSTIFFSEFVYYVQVLSHPVCLCLLQGPVCSHQTHL